MATLDHRKLDARASARLEVKRVVDSFTRRLLDEAYTAIDAAFQSKLAAGREFDGHEVGRETTLAIIEAHVTDPEPPAIEDGQDGKSV